jgi:hypothetical protein
VQVTRDELQVTRDELQVTQNKLQVMQDELQVTQDELQVTRDGLLQTQHRLAYTERAVIHQQNWESRRYATNALHDCISGVRQGIIAFFNKKYHTNYRSGKCSHQSY